MSGLGKRILEEATSKGITAPSDGKSDPLLESDATKKLLKVDKSRLDVDELLSVDNFMIERLSLGDWKHER